ncbi:MAG: phospholipase D family protein [Betaproteobacteria bacterium]|nr:phospholipase D family protein [Betaproteobacteria bacterium]
MGFFAMLGIACAQDIPDTIPKPAASEPAKVMGLYFTPPSDAAKAVIDAIDQSRNEILVQAYGFTHLPMAQALIRAHARGVKVQVMLDEKSQSTNRNVIDILREAQVPLRMDGQHAIAHNKVMVLDTQTVITGSYNFTNAAQSRNAENLLILGSPELAQNYKDNWQQHWEHSR